MRQMLAVALISSRDIVMGRGALVLAGVAVTAVFSLGPALLDDELGTPLWPATQLVTAFLGGVFFIKILIALLTTFYAGELVWRERDARLSEIADATPVPDWVPFAGKLLALGLVLVTLLTVLMAAGVLLQVFHGYFNFEIGLYLRVLFGLRLADCLLFAALAMLVHVLVDRKFSGT